ncbi:MAG: ABC transporter permease [Clostridiales bacterium]|nr:ABC transporter permease [Clostridiales bacterium]
MSKLAALYHNEMVKLSHRMLVWILVILMILTAFFMPFMLKNLIPEESGSSYSEIGKTEITKERDTAKSALGDPNRYVEHETLRFTIDNQTVELFATKLNLTDDQFYSYEQLSCFNAILANYDFDAYPINGTYLSINAFYAYRMAFERICLLNMEPFRTRTNEWYDEYIFATRQLDLAKEAFFYHDYGSYLEYQENEVPDFNSTSISTLQKVIELDPEGKLSDRETEDIIEAIGRCEEYKSNLAMGIDNVDGTKIPLSESRKTQIEDRVKILEYQIEHNCLITDKASNATTVRQVAQKAARFLLVILLIIIAGSSISQEMATGSIKSLIIAPVKRWKIFTSKLFALITWVLAGSILITLITTISTALCMGSSSLPPYYYCSGGEVVTMPNLLFSFLFFLADNISLFVYLLGAFTISCFTRNTGVAVGISTGLVFCNSSFAIVGEIVGHKRWIDFLPFSNMDLSCKIFPYFDLSGYMDAGEAGLFGIGTNNALSLRFSLIYLAILVFILLLTAYDGFVKRDIP